MQDLAEGLRALRAWRGGLLVAVGLMLASCAREPSVVTPPSRAPGDAELKALLDPIVRTRILFGHQSVGNNILAGVRRLAARLGSSLQVRSTRLVGPEDFGLNEFLVGRNEDPERKFADFEATVAASADNVDVAALKLCYIDFAPPQTDPEALAGEYIRLVERLQARYPKIRFVAITSPLTIVQTGPKAWIKRALGRAPGGYELNARRYVFNERLRSAFGPDRLFDLARLESRGTGAVTLHYEGRPLEALADSWTSDGGHLNRAGEDAIAVEFVRFLASQLR